MVDRLMNSEANTKRIGRVEQCFGTFGQPLNVPGRVLVGEGILIKMCRRKPKPRQVFLFNDILVYGSILISRRKFSRQHIINLEEVYLKDLPDNDLELKFGWLIMTPSKSFAVYAANESEKHQWMTHINNCAESLLSATGKTRAKNAAAVWVPDSDATECMVCQKSQFTVFNRRHHCRACGVLVCGNCSKHKILMPSQSDRPVRVCDTCYMKNTVQASPATKTFVRTVPPPPPVLLSSTGPPARPRPPSSSFTPSDTTTTPQPKDLLTSTGDQADGNTVPPLTPAQEATADSIPSAAADLNASNASSGSNALDTSTGGDGATSEPRRGSAGGGGHRRRGSSGDGLADTSDDSDGEDEGREMDMQSLSLEDQTPTFYNADDSEKRNSDPASQSSGDLPPIPVAATEAAAAAAPATTAVQQLSVDDNKTPASEKSQPPENGSTNGTTILTPPKD